MELTGPQGDEQGGTVASVDAPVLAPSAPAFGHAAFSGNVAARLEPTGRLAIPAVYRPLFSGQARTRAPTGASTSCSGPSRRSHRWPPPWPPRAVSIDPQARKNLYRATQTVAVDRQGRLVVPPDLRERVGLTDQVVVVGSIESLEIYSAAAFERLTALEDADLFFDTFDGLPTDPACVAFLPACSPDPVHRSVCP